MRTRLTRLSSGFRPGQMLHWSCCATQASTHVLMITDAADSCSALSATAKAAGDSHEFLRSAPARCCSSSAGFMNFSAGSLRHNQRPHWRGVGGRRSRSPAKRFPAPTDGLGARFTPARPRVRHPVAQPSRHGHAWSETLRQAVRSPRAPTTRTW